MSFLRWRLSKQPQDSPSSPAHITERNIRYLYIEILFASILGGIITFNSAFAIRLGASNELNALLYSAPALLSAIASIPSAHFLARRVNRRLWLFGSIFIMRVGYLVIALMPLLFPRDQVATFVVLWIVALNLPTIFFTNGWHVLLGEIIPNNRRAFVISRRQILWSFGLVIVSALGGQWLDQVTFPTNYMLLYAFGFFTVLGSQYYNHRLRFEDHAPRHTVPGDVSEQSVKMRGPIKRMLINSLIYHFGLNLPAALFVPYYINGLHVTDGWIGLNSAAANAGVILGYFLWERQLRQHSYGWTQRRATMFTWLFPVLLAFFTDLNVIMFVNFIVNIMHSGVDLSNFNVLLEISDAHERATYVSWYNTVLNLSLFLGPFVGAFLSTHVSLIFVLVLSGVVRILGGLFYNLYRVDAERTWSQQTSL